MDADGQPISVEPRYLLVPNSLKHLAIEFTQGPTLIMCGTDNVVRPARNVLADEHLQVISSPYLGNSGYEGSSQTGWYLFGRAAWNPDLDYQRKIAEIESDYYGKLYPAMKKYNDLRRKLWKEAVGCVGFPFGDQRTPRVLQTPGSKEQLMEYLDEAEKLAAGQPGLLELVKFERECLEHYWIKPNERYRRNLTRTASAPSVAHGPVIDGSGKDAVWGQACYLTDFLTAYGSKAKSAQPPELATSIGILSDRENLYFLIRAGEPDPSGLKAEATEADKGKIWKDDTVEIFLTPPNNNFKYYQFVINTRGVVMEIEQPGSNMKVSLGAEAKTAVGRKGYVIEVKIPVRKLEGVFGSGQIWKVHAARNRRVPNRTEFRQLSLDAIGYHTTMDYHSMVIGSPIVKNGSFEEGIGKNGAPKFWGFQGREKGKAELVRRSGNHAVRLTAGAVVTQILYGGYFRPGTAKKVKVSFKASGKGAVWCINARFDQVPDQKGKLKNRFLGGHIAGKFQLSEQAKIYQCEYTIPPREFSQLRLVPIGKGAECLIDDVTVQSAE